MSVKTIHVDVETTGTDETKDTIIELAALCGDSEFHCYCCPSEKPANFDEVSKASHGLTWEFLQENGVPEDVLYMRFIAWLDTHVDKFNKQEKAVFTGYNALFDTRFVRKLFERHYNKFYGSYFFSIVDDIQSHVANAMRKGLIPMFANYKLATVCDHFGISFRAHSAIDDIKATRELEKEIEYLGSNK